MIYIGIDNGISGSVGWVNETCSLSGVFSMPTFCEQDYVKKKQNITRVDTKGLKKQFNDFVFEHPRRIIPGGGIVTDDIRVIMERPMINPMRFRATMSAIRAWEATLIVLAEFPWPRVVVDSRGWQKEMLPAGCNGKELKVASVQVGCRLFPNHVDWIRDQGDADSLLIAEYSRRNKL
ncbi:MAG: hypothetical protein PHN78_02185 [Dehalococcoidales bacterium]|nr:hypothetical protein [Dehalococcoidales bacterium]